MVCELCRLAELLLLNNAYCGLIVDAFINSSLRCFCVDDPLCGFLLGEHHHTCLIRFCIYKFDSADEHVNTVEERWVNVRSGVGGNGANQPLSHSHIYCFTCII